MRVIQIGADRSKRGILQQGSAAYLRQQAYADVFGSLDIIALTLTSDGATELAEGSLHIIPTRSASKWSYALDARSIAKKLPRPDVISSQDPFETGLAAWFIARRLKVPLHVQVHTDFLSPVYAKHSHLNRFRLRIARFVLERASGIRVVSDSIKHSLQASGWRLKTAPVVLPIYADIERIKALPPSAAMRARFERYRLRLLVVSRLEPEKRVSLAVDAFARASKDDTCLIIVGEGSERAVLERQAEELGVGDRVFFEGTVEAAPYYHLADLVLVSSEYEGYGLVIVEALGIGKPVLSTDVGIAREAEATMIAPASLFAEALQKWIDHGPRAGTLKLQSHRSFDAYVQAYCADIIACAKRQK